MRDLKKCQQRELEKIIVKAEIVVGLCLAIKIENGNEKGGRDSLCRLSKIIYSGISHNTGVYTLYFINSM